MAKVSGKNTPATESEKPAAKPAGNIIDAGSIRLDAKLDEAEARAAEVAYLKPFIQTEAEAAIKRGREAKKVLNFLPPNAVGRPPKYASIIAEAKHKIETGAVDVTAPNSLTKFVESLTTSPAARKTIRNNLQAAWDAALKKRLPEIP
jgi:hypothetical protein